jgi:putative lipoic acid-binding regulatory protein
MDGKQFARRFGRVHQKDIPVNDLPSIALLESVHSFPGPYVFKVIGRNELGFVARAVAAVREELGSEQDPPYRVRESVGGRHAAVTLEPVVQTARQVLAVYRRLRPLVGLVMLW